MTTPKKPPEPPTGPVRLRIPGPLLERMRADLERPHPFAEERIGFLSVATGRGHDGEWILLASGYDAVPDGQYVDDPRAGARISGQAIRAALQRVLDTGRGVLHVHLHAHEGMPRFSWMDRQEQPRLVQSLRVVGGRVPHGMLVLSNDRANAWIWLPDAEGPVVPEMISFVQHPTTLIAPADPEEWEENAPAAEVRFARQSFLGSRGQTLLERARIGLVGVGGGGSHVAQQLAHLGVRKLWLFDQDHVETTNLNRVVTATARDADEARLKVEIAGRRIQEVLPTAQVTPVARAWQEEPALLRGCDVVIGCVDTFAGRRDLESTCRRYGIPYLDIGMDVNQVEGEPPRMGGQVILSLPGGPCMFCLGFLNEERLGREAALYGAGGGRPQVVWPNGVLASTAVGIAVDLLTGWSRRGRNVTYLSYDGNDGTLLPHVRTQYLDGRPCPHYPSHSVGDPVFRSLAA